MNVNLDPSSSRKSILVIDRFYFPDEQATSVYLTELTTGLKDQFQFEILCGPPAVVTERISARPSSCVHQVPAIRLPKQFLFSRFLGDLSFLIAALLRGLFLERPDLVFSQTSPPGVWWVGYLLSRWHRARWVHVWQDVFPDNLKIMAVRIPGFLFALLDFLSCSPLPKADRMLVLGEDMEKRVLKKGFASGLVSRTHNWVDPDFVRPLSKKNPFSQRLGVADKFVVLYAGNFGRVHNLEDLVGAAERFRNDPRVLFLFVGEGARKPWLLGQIETKGLSNVRVAPFEPRSRLPEVLASADVSVILLLKGMAGLSVPSKIYSILASGRPVLASVEKESDIARMVEDSQSGFVVSPGDTAALAKVIQGLVDRPELGRQAGQNGRRFIEKADFKAKALRDYAKVFHEVLGR